MRLDRRSRGLLVLLAATTGLTAVCWFGRTYFNYWVMVSLLRQRREVRSVVESYGPKVQRRLAPLMQKGQVAWPPARLTLLAFKAEKKLEVWVANQKGPWAHVTTYSILGLSGQMGPKRREGDRQVPEGFYGLPVLNPNSRFHLSVLINYPNEEDRAHTGLPPDQIGGEIFIHGRQGSRGCLAIGDEAIEEVFCLVAQVTSEHRSIIISPVDFRTGAKTPRPESPWIADLYRRLAQALTQFPTDNPSQRLKSGLPSLP